jgi:hypothetical protein
MRGRSPAHPGIAEFRDSLGHVVRFGLLAGAAAPKFICAFYASVAPDSTGSGPIVCALPAEVAQSDRLPHRVIFPLNDALSR